MHYFKYLYLKSLIPHKKSMFELILSNAEKISIFATDWDWRNTHCYTASLSRMASQLDPTFSKEVARVQVTTVYNY